MFASAETTGSLPSRCRDRRTTATARRDLRRRKSLIQREIVSAGESPIEAAAKPRKDRQNLPAVLGIAERIQILKSRRRTQSSANWSPNSESPVKQANTGSFGQNGVSSTDCLPEKPGPGRELQLRTCAEITGQYQVFNRKHFADNRATGVGVAVDLDCAVRVSSRSLERRSAGNRLEGHQLVADGTAPSASRPWCRGSARP